MSVPSQIQRAAKCGICGNSELTSFLVQEIQIGFAEMFQYGHCSTRGALTRLSKIPDKSEEFSVSWGQILAWKRQATVLRKNSIGDQAAFYLRREE